MSINKRVFLHSKKDMERAFFPQNINRSSPAGISFTSEPNQSKREWERGEEELDFGIGGINLRPRSRNNYYNIYFRKRLTKLTENIIELIINDSIFSLKRKRQIENDDFENKINKIVDYISSLKPNWDGDGSIPYERITLDRMKSFVFNLRKKLFYRFNVSLIFPYIMPGPEGSIDIHWKNDRYTLLINIPNNNNEEITIAGYENKFKNRKNVIKRSTDYQTALRVLSQWLSIAMMKKI